MNVLEFILISFALIIDSMVVCTVNGMTYKNITHKQVCVVVLLFGITQGMFIGTGHFIGQLFSSFLNQYAGIITAAIFSIIGISKIKDTLTQNSEEIQTKETVSYKVILIQAIATSLDAFAVGISFSLMAVNMIQAVIFITIVTIVFSYVAIKLGQKSSDMLGGKAELWGGIFLLFVAIRALL